MPSSRTIWNGYTNCAHYQWTGEKALQITTQYDPIDTPQLDGSSIQPTKIQELRPEKSSDYIKKVKAWNVEQPKPEKNRLSTGSAGLAFCDWYLALPADCQTPGKGVHVWALAKADLLTHRRSQHFLCITQIWEQSTQRPELKRQTST